jgi:type IX secretion system PorP/SprF family membrane protein
MRYSLIILSFIFSAVHAFGQSAVSRTQQYINPEWNHPALTGMSNSLKLGVSFRQSITSSNNTLRLYQAGVFLPIKNSYNNETDNSGFALSSPLLNEELGNNKRSRRKHGVGLHLSNLSVDAFNRQSISAFYAYHLPVSDKLTTSFGTSLNYIQNNYGVDQLTVENTQDELYQMLLQEGFNNSMLLADFSVALYSKALMITTHISSITLTENKSDLVEAANNAIIYGLAAAYQFQLGTDFVISSFVSFKANPQYQHDLNLSLRIKYSDMVYAGFGIQNDFKYSALAGIKLPKAIFLDYSYDRFNNAGGVLAGGMHEISLSYIIQNKKLDSPFLW